MSHPTIPGELTSYISPADWDRSGIVAHRSAIMEYPKNTKLLLEKKLFSFQDLTRFEWQELQALLINVESVERLVTTGFPAEKFHLYDAPQLIEILHHPNQFRIIIKEGVSPEELAKFSGYELKLVLSHPESMAAILKNFEGVDDLLKLRWNWIEEMLMRPEDALALLVYGVKWDQIDHLQAWDFGWFLRHRHEIMALLDYGIDFDVIAHLDSSRLRLAPLKDSGIEKKDLEALDFYQIFMLLAHRDHVKKFIDEGVPKEEFLRLDSIVMEKLLQNPLRSLMAFKRDPKFPQLLIGVRPIKVDLLLKDVENYVILVKAGISLHDLKPLMDDQFQLVLENPGEFITLIELAEKFSLPKQGVLNLDLQLTSLMNQNRDQLEKLLGINITFDDLTRFPLIFPQVLQFAESIISLSKRGIPTEEIFHLSTDQIQYAFQRFPLLDILPEIGLTVKDIQPYRIEEFKEILAHLKAFSVLKKGGVDMRILTQISMPHLGVILKYPEYVLSLTEKGVPLYKFDLLDAHKLRVMLQNPLTPEAQLLVQELMQK